MSEIFRRLYIKSLENTLKTSNGNFRNIQNLSSPTRTKQLNKSSETEYSTTTSTQKQPSAGLTQKTPPSFHSHSANNNGNGNGNDNDGEKSVPRISNNVKEIYNFSLVIGTITGLTLLVVIGAIFYRKKYHHRFGKILARFRKKNNKKNKNNNNDKNYDDYDLYYSYNNNNNNNNNNNKENAYSASNSQNGARFDSKNDLYYNHNNNNNHDNQEGAYSASNSRSGARFDSKNDLYYNYNNNNNHDNKEGVYSASNDRDGSRLDNKKILYAKNDTNNNNKKKNSKNNKNNNNNNANINRRNNILQYQNFVKEDEDAAPQQKSQTVLHEISQQQQSSHNIINYNRIKDVNNRINETTKVLPVAYIPNALPYTHNYYDGESDSFKIYTASSITRPFNNNTGQSRTKTSSTSLSSTHSNDNRKKVLPLDRIDSEITQQNNSSKSVALDINDGNNNNVNDDNYRNNEQEENNDNNNIIIHTVYPTSHLSTNITPSKPQPSLISQNISSPLSSPPLYSLTPTPISMKSRNIMISDSFETSTSPSSDYSKSNFRKGHLKLVSWLDGSNDDDIYDQNVNSDDNNDDDINETAEINKDVPNTGDYRANNNNNNNNNNSGGGSNSSSSSSSVYDYNVPPKINNKYTHNVEIDGDGYSYSEDIREGKIVNVPSSFDSQIVSSNNRTVRNKDGNDGDHSIVSIINTNKTTQLELVNEDEYMGYEEYYEEIMEGGEEGEEEYYEAMTEEDDDEEEERSNEGNAIGLPLELPEVPQVSSKNLSINFERFSLFKRELGHAENRHINIGNIRGSGLRNGNIRGSGLRNGNIRGSGLRNNNVRSSGVGNSEIRNNDTRNRNGNNYNTSNLRNIT